VLKLSSYLQKLFKVLKFAAPFASPVAGIAVSSYQDIKYDIKLGNELIKKLPEWQQEINWEDLEQLRRGLKSEEISGAQLREIRALLDQLDPKQHWGGLSKLLTPEHHYLWLCEHHYKKLKEEYY
jgi:internalin A